VIDVRVYGHIVR
jgi:hypothetical protein